MVDEILINNKTYMVTLSIPNLLRESTICMYMFVNL
jgi:hypothetical protein